MAQNIMKHDFCMGCSLIFVLEILQSLIDFLLVFAPFLARLVLLIIKANEVFAGHVEPVQVVHCLLGLVDVIVDDEAGALGLAGVALADLANRAKLAKNVVEFVRADLERQVSHEDDPVDLRWQPLIRLYLRVHFG